MQHVVFDYNLTIGGQAGQGMQTVGYLLAKAFLKIGYFITTYQSYESRIRGGHNFFQIRVASEPVHSMTAGIDVLIALDKRTIREHCDRLKPGALVMYDAEKIRPEAGCANMLGLEISKISPEARKLEVLVNTLYVGIVIGLMRCPAEPVREILRRLFASKGEKIVNVNLNVLDAGLAFVKERQFEGRLASAPPAQAKTYLPIHGNDALALGAIAADCRFYSAYPMTPSTSILDAVASHMADTGMVVEQAEDEIAALNMAIGASYAGVRAMAGTSGGGFSLMAETLSLAGMIESPVVVAVAQRPGPATGLPTRSEQGELEYLIHAGHGEFPRAIFAPGNHAQCFEVTAHAFNIADRYQTPALVLTDQYLADLFQNVEPFDGAGIAIDRGRLVAPDDDYARYRLTDDGISPRGIPGKGPGVVIADSDEHDELGHLTEDLELRRRMNEKRLLKMDGLEQEALLPEITGQARDNLVICWGSAYGPCRDAVQALNRQGRKISLMHFRQVWPLPAEKIELLLSGYENLIMVENNATGQLARVIRAETSIAIPNRILKYDGRPFMLEELSEAIASVIV